MNDHLKSFAEEFDDIVRSQGNQIALIDALHDKEYTYGEVANLLARFEALFHEHNLTKGDVVLCLVPNSVETLILFFAAAYHGMGFAPITTDAQHREVLSWAALVNPKLLIVADIASESCREAAAKVDVKSVVIKMDGDFNWLPPAREGNRKAHAAGRLYLTTSGSTGEPKAMVFSIDTLWRSAKAFLAAHPTASNDSRFYNFLPMSYLGGLFNLGLIPIASKGSVVVAESFSGRSFLDFWQNVERFEVNVLWLVPTIARGLLTLAERTGRHQLASINGAVKFGFIGTAPIDLETKNRFESTFGIPILENFALSETTFISSETLTNKDSRVAGSVGQRLPYVDIDFRPIAKADEDSEDFKSSEILVRTPFFFLGYLKHDGSIESPLDANGFMATGDVGHLDDEGRLIIEGRYRDIIKKGGYFIALLEIENLAKTNPSVEEVAAVKVSHNFYGEDSVLLVRFKPNSTINIDQFGQWLRQNLVKYKWPERILAVDEFPRTQSGKIRKHLIKI